MDFFIALVALFLFFFSLFESVCVYVSLGDFVCLGLLLPFVLGFCLFSFFVCFVLFFCGFFVGFFVFSFYDCVCVYFFV